MLNKSRRTPLRYPTDWTPFEKRLKHEKFAEIIIFTGMLGDTDQVQRQELIRGDREAAEFFARRWAREIRNELAIDVHYLVRTYSAIAQTQTYGVDLMDFLGAGI